MGNIHEFVDSHIYPLDPHNDYRFVFETFAGVFTAGAGYGELQHSGDKAWLGAILLGGAMIADAARHHFGTPIRQENMHE